MEHDPGPIRGEPGTVIVCVDPTNPELGAQRLSTYEAVKHYAQCLDMLCAENWQLKCALAEARGEAPPRARVATIPQIND